MMRRMALTRRELVQTLGLTTGVGWLGNSVIGAAGQGHASEDDRTVHLSGDGLALPPRAYTALLDQLTRKADVDEDNYLLGGEIARFEQRWATLLGKETAVFMPSGTLANQLALRALAGSRRRVIVPEMSHVYNDTGDACQTLSGLTLMPLAPGAATFTRAEIEAVLARTAGGRVATDIGAILIESPIRRLSGQMFDWDEAKRITGFARERGIGTHLDGARLFIASAYTGISPAEYAAAFDTVYISLWKYFNCGIGAILAGPKRVLDGMFHVRRMFGGNLAAGWPAALVAAHYMDGFVDRLKSAVRVSEEFYRAIAGHPKVAIERIPNGTNLTRLTLKNVDGARLVARLAERGVRMPHPRRVAASCSASTRAGTARAPRILHDRSSKPSASRNRSRMAKADPPCGPGDLVESFGEIDIYLFDQLLRGRITPQMRLLDAGCGGGRNAHYLMRCGADVYGIDDDGRQIDRIRSLAAQLAPALPARNFVVGPLTALPWADRVLRGGHLQRRSALRHGRSRIRGHACRDVAGPGSRRHLLRASGLHHRHRESRAPCARPPASAARWQ